MVEVEQQIIVDEAMGLDYWLSLVVTIVYENRLWVKFSLWPDTLVREDIEDAIKPGEEDFSNHLVFTDGAIAHCFSEVVIESVSNNAKEAHVRTAIGIEKKKRGQQLEDYLLSECVEELIFDILIESGFVEEIPKVIHMLHYSTKDGWDNSIVGQHGYAAGDTFNGNRYEKKLSSN